MKTATPFSYLVRLGSSTAFLASFLFSSAALAQDEAPPEPEPESPPAETEEVPADTEVEPSEDLEPLPDPDEAPALPIPEELEFPSLVAPGEVDLLLPADEGAFDEGDALFSADYDLVLKDGRILSGARIQGKTASGLMVFHETGATDVPAFLLPDALVKAYQLDVATSRKVVAALRAEEAKKAKAKLEAQRERQALRSLPSVNVEGTVVSVHEGGIVLECPDPPDLEAQGLQRIGGMIRTTDGQVPPDYVNRIFGTLWVTGHPDQTTVVDGDRLIFQAKITGRHQEGAQTFRAVAFERVGTRR